MAHKMMPVKLHKKHWTPGKQKHTSDSNGKKVENRQLMQSFLQQKKGR